MRLIYDLIKEQESQRNFLTIKEARSLFTTPCSKKCDFKCPTVTMYVYVCHDLAKKKFFLLAFPR